MVRRTSLFLVLGLAAAVGCKQSQFVPASGKVTQGKQPVAGANVVFHYPNGESAVGITDAGGRYSLNSGAQNGARPGEKIPVTVVKFPPVESSVTPPPVSGPPPIDTTQPTPKDMGKGAPKNLLPPEYGDPKNPKLNLDIPAGGTDKLDIALP